MIDELKTLSTDAMITIDHDGVKDSFDVQDFVVKTIDHFDLEEGEIVLLRSDDYTLVAYECSGVERYFFYEIYDEGNDSRFIRKDRFVKQFKIQTEDVAGVYKITEESPLISDDEEKKFSQYKSNKFLDAAMVEFIDEKQWVLYVGFEIESDNLIA